MTFSVVDSLVVIDVNNNQADRLRRSQGCGQLLRLGFEATPIAEASEGIGRAQFVQLPGMLLESVLSRFESQYCADPGSQLSWMAGLAQIVLPTELKAGRDVITGGSSSRAPYGTSAARQERINHSARATGLQHLLLPRYSNRWTEPNSVDPLESPPDLTSTIATPWTKWPAQLTLLIPLVHLSEVKIDQLTLCSILNSYARTAGCCFWGPRTSPMMTAAARSRSSMTWL